MAMRTGCRLAGLLCGAAAAALCPALAQDEAEDAGDVIIVTGTPGGAGVDRMEASFAVSLIDEETIERFAPLSTADLFELIPGVWTESTGGVAGANVFVRGFPAAGDAEFLTVSLQGAPIFTPATLSFLENTQLFRIDRTVERVEALRGGPNAVFSNGQIGLTTNFVLAEGGDFWSGLVEATASDYGLARLDGMIGGPLTDEVSVMAGGYVRRADGLRDPGFDGEPGIEGHQFTVHLSGGGENGEFLIDTRHTDDAGTWYLPFAVNVPGLDLGEYIQLGERTRFRTLQTGPDRFERFDFQRGRGWDGSASGARLEYALGGGVTLREQVSYTRGQANTFGFVPDGGAVRAGAVTDAWPALGPLTTSGGAAIGEDRFVQNYGHWAVLKDIEALTNDLSLSKTLGRHELTVGYFYSGFSSEDRWSLGNAIPVLVEANGPQLGASVACEDLAAAGSGSSCFRFGLSALGEANLDALYLADSWQLTERFRLDLGARFESFDSVYTADTGPGFADGTVDVDTAIGHEEWSFTAGAHYRLTDRTTAFARATSGVKMPSFDDLREGFDGVKEVTAYEVGYKISEGPVALFLTGFYNEFEGATFTDIQGRTGIDTNRARGVELEGSYLYPIGLRLDLNATWQRTEVIASSDPSIIGNEALRQPDYQVRIAPSYDVALPGGYGASVYGAAQLVGERFSDSFNTQKLEDYRKFDLGMVVRSPDDRLTLQVAIDNLTDSEGLTEGDPRALTAANARPLLGRSVQVSLAYGF